MKNTQKIKALEKLKKFFLIQVKKGTKDHYISLCVILKYLYSSRFSFKEYEFLLDLLYEKSKKVPVGYRYVDVNEYDKVTISNSNRHACFLWKPYAVKPRINWIDKQIAELSKPSILDLLQRLRSIYFSSKIQKCLCNTINEKFSNKERVLLKQFIQDKLKESPVVDLWYSYELKVLDRHYMKSTKYFDKTPERKLGFYLFKPYDVKSRLKFLDDEITKLEKDGK